MKTFAALALAVLPHIAIAQTSDIAADFREAFDLYYPGGDADRQTATLYGPGPIEGIEGRWLPTQQLFPDGAYDLEVATKFCAQNGYEFALWGRFGFTLTQVRRNELTDYVVTYSYVSGSTFTRSADLEGVAKAIFGDRDLSRMPPVSVLGALNQGSLHGYAILRWYTEDILVIESNAAPPAIYTRCPQAD